MDIEDLRNEIDVLDRNIVELLNKRAVAAHEIGRLKRQTSLPIYEPRREATILRNVSEANTGPLSNADLQSIYESIIAVMRALQRSEIESDEEPPNRMHDELSDAMETRRGPAEKT